MFKNPFNKSDDAYGIVKEKDVLDQFATMVSFSDRGFSIATERGQYCFVLVKCGKGRIVYQSREDLQFDRETLPPAELTSMKRVAVVMDNKIYILDDSVFAGSRMDNEKVACYNMGEIRERASKVFEKVMGELYDETQPAEISRDDIDNLCTYYARQHLLEGKEFRKESFCGTIAITEDNYIEDLCGIINIKKTLLDRYKDMAPRKKALHMKSVELMKNPEYLLSMRDYDISEALKKCNAEYVRVFFRKFQMEDAAECTPQTVIRNLAWNQPFTDHDFRTKQQGKALYRNLNCDEHSRALVVKGANEKRVVNKKDVYPGWPNCDDIIKIEANGETIFEEKAES